MTKIRCVFLVLNLLGLCITTLGFAQEATALATLQQGYADLREMRQLIQDLRALESHNTHGRTNRQQVQTAIAELETRANQYEYNIRTLRAAYDETIEAGCATLQASAVELQILDNSINQLRASIATVYSSQRALNNDPDTTNRLLWQHGPEFLTHRAEIQSFLTQARTLLRSHRATRRSRFQRYQQLHAEFPLCSFIAFQDAPDGQEPETSRPAFDGGVSQ